MPRLLLLAAAATLVATGAWADTYVLAGQSNMSGRGSLDELTAAERAPEAAIRLYGNDGQWRVAATCSAAARNRG